MRARLGALCFVHVLGFRVQSKGTNSLVQTVATEIFGPQGFGKESLLFQPRSNFLNAATPGTRSPIPPKVLQKAVKSSLLMLAEGDVDKTV